MSQPAVRNQLNRTVAKFDGLPTPLRRAALSFVLGNVVPYIGTSKLRFDELKSERVVVSVKNRRRVQNHIKNVHAAAMALLAETATGFCVTIKTLKVDYLKRTQGDMRAVAQLSPEQIRLIQTLDKGEVTVPVSITDASGGEPISAEMVWAWVPKKRG